MTKDIEQNFNKAESLIIQTALKSGKIPAIAVDVYFGIMEKVQNSKPWDATELSLVLRMIDNTMYYGVYSATVEATKHRLINMMSEELSEQEEFGIEYIDGFFTKDEHELIVAVLSSLMIDIADVDKYRKLISFIKGNEELPDESSALLNMAIEKTNFSGTAIERVYKLMLKLRVDKISENVLKGKQSIGRPRKGLNK